MQNAVKVIEGGKQSFFMSRRMTSVLALVLGTGVGLALFVLFGLNYTTFHPGAVSLKGLPLPWMTRGTGFWSPVNELNLVLDLGFWVVAVLLVDWLLLRWRFISQRSKT
jgi:hypothetical protein